jgi:hypothetical protein
MEAASNADGRGRDVEGPEAPKVTLTAALLALAFAACLGAGCAPQVNDLLVEAGSGDPESIQTAVVEGGDLLRRKEQAGVPYDPGDERLIEYLREVAASRSSPLNRMQAISSLSQLARVDAGALFLAALDDPYWAVRMEGARALSVRPVPGKTATLVEHLEKEARIEVRLWLIKALSRAGGEDALQALLTVLLDRTGRYETLKLSAHEAVCALSDRRYELRDATSWQNFYDERFGKRATGPLIGPALPGAPAPAGSGAP